MTHHLAETFAPRWLLLASLAFAPLLANCDATAQLQAVSAGQIGCSPADITITDDEPGLGARSWVAWCGSEQYQCSNGGNAVHCAAAHHSEPSSAPPPAATPPAAPSKWVQHDFKACGVTAQFPLAPKEEAGRTQTSAGPEKTWTATTELSDNRGAFAVSCSAVMKKHVPADVVLDGARDGFLKTVGATLADERDILGGREILFELQGEQGLAHLWWVSNRLIVATAMPLSGVGPTAAKRFVNGVELSAPR